MAKRSKKSRKNVSSKNLKVAKKRVAGGKQVFTVVVDGSNSFVLSAKKGAEPKLWAPNTDEYIEMMKRFQDYVEKFGSKNAAELQDAHDAHVVGHRRSYPERYAELKKDEEAFQRAKQNSEIVGKALEMIGETKTAEKATSKAVKKSKKSSKAKASKKSKKAKTKKTGKKSKKAAAKEAREKLARAKSAKADKKSKKVKKSKKAAKKSKKASRKR